MSSHRPRLIGAILSLIGVSVLVPDARPQSAPEGPAPVCAIDMGSNTFRRIVGSFQNGKYVQRPVEKKTMGIGDEVEKRGRISDAQLAEIGAVLSAFKASCVKEGVTRVAAIGTAAFRRSRPNGASPSWPTWSARSVVTATL
jgi:hypothetical protein